MNTKTVYILIGPAGCGKTTWANNKLLKESTLKLLSSDKIREEITGSEADISRDKEVWETIGQIYRNYLVNEHSFIFDATNYRIKNRKNFVDEAVAMGYNVVAVDCFSGLDSKEVHRRNNIRERRVPTFVIDNMIRGFIPPSINEGFSEIINVN